MPMCNFLISKYRPKYFGYGIELNMMLDAIKLGKISGQAWINLSSALGTIYFRLKMDNPGVQILYTLQAGSFYQDQVFQKTYLDKITVWTDILAISSYPFLDYRRVEELPSDYFSKIASLSIVKPFAIAEQGWPAENITYPDPLPAGSAPLVNIPFTSQDQAKYVRFMLENVLARPTAFVGWWVSRDADETWATHFSQWPEPNRWIARLFRDVGLFEGGTGAPREAAYTWTYVRSYQRRSL